MNDAGLYIEAMKIALRRAGVTYAEVAGALGVSQSTVKRWFSRGSLTLSRLGEICDLVGLSIAELTPIVQRSSPLLENLSVEQEQALTEDIKLLLVCYLTLQDWSAEEILANYALDPLELTRLYARLDQLRIIDLWPGNRVRIRIAPNFAWLPHGPIRRFFDAHVRRDFFKSKFDAPGEAQYFAYGMLSQQGIEQFNRRIRRLVEEYDASSRADRPLPLAERFGTSLVVALRRWGFSAFDALRRS